MELKLSQEFLTENDCYQAGRKIVPKGIMVHSTGVAQPDPQVFIRRWNKPGGEVPSGVRPRLRGQDEVIRPPFSFSFCPGTGRECQWEAGTQAMELAENGS